MATTRLPDAYWPDPPNDEDANPDPSPSSPTDTAQQPSVIQQTLSGPDTVIPIVYGKARLGALISLVTTYQSRLLLCAVWCMGEVKSVSVRINDEAPPSGVLITTYLGTPSQAVDPTLAAAIPGFTDRMVYEDPKHGSVGIAYSVIQIPANLEEINGFPNITAEIEGRLVYCCLAGQRTYSTNPAAALGDLISDPILGMRREVDLVSQTAVSQACSEVMGDGKARRSINIALTNAQEVTQWIETLRGYAGCMLFFDGDKAVMVANRPPTVTTPITADEILKDSLRIRKKVNPPNVVRVSYTDVTAEPWRTHSAMAIHPDVSAGLVSWNEETIAMPGIQNYSQAYREAEERLNAYRYANLEVEFVLLDEGLLLTTGEVILLTHPTGFTDAPFRIEAIDSVDEGRWRVLASPYTASLYSDAAPTTPAFPNIKPPNSTSPDITDSPLSLQLTEVFTTLPDGTPISKIQATWSASPGINFKHYEIQWGVGTSPTSWNSDHSATASWLSPQVTRNQLYTVRVRTVATDGAVGAWATNSITIVGKTSNTWAPPAPPAAGEQTTFTLTFTWQYPAGATDIAWTEIWFSTSSSPGTPFPETEPGTRTKISAVAYPGNSYSIHGRQAGECRYFWIRYLDTSGNLSSFYPTGNGTQVCTPTVSTESAILTYLQSRISEQQLTNNLLSVIETASDDSANAIQIVQNLEADIGGEYYVKIQTDINGELRVAGFGLSNLVGEPSTFLIASDRFAIVHPSLNDTNPARFPFVVDNGFVWMEGAFIRELSVENAKIQNLTIGTQKINYNQVSSVTGAYNGTVYTYSSSRTQTLFGSGVSLEAGNVYAYGIFVQFSFTAGYSGYQQTGIIVPSLTLRMTISQPGTGFSSTYSVPVTCLDGIQLAAWYPPVNLNPNFGVIANATLTVTPGSYYDETFGWIPVACYSAEHGIAVAVYKR